MYLYLKWALSVYCFTICNSNGGENLFPMTPVVGACRSIHVGIDLNNLRKMSDATETYLGEVGLTVST